MENKNQNPEKELMTRSIFMSHIESIIRESTNMPIHNDMPSIPVKMKKKEVNP